MYIAYICLSMLVTFVLGVYLRMASTRYVDYWEIVDVVSFYVMVLTIVATTIWLGVHHNAQTSFFVAFLGLANATTGYIIKKTLESRMYESWKRTDIGLSDTNPMETTLGKNAYIIGVGLGNMGMVMLYVGLVVGLIQK